jgi:hypothetical protein
MPEHASRTMFTAQEVNVALRSLEKKIGMLGAESLVYHLHFFAITINNTEFFAMRHIEGYLKMVFGDGSKFILDDVRRALIDQTRPKKVAL